MPGQEPAQRLVEGREGLDVAAERGEQRRLEDQRPGELAGERVRWASASRRRISIDRASATCVDIPGETTHSYRVRAEDRYIRYVLTATSDGGSTRAASVIRRALDCVVTHLSTDLVPCATGALGQILTD